MSVGNRTRLILLSALIAIAGTGVFMLRHGPPSTKSAGPAALSPSTVAPPLNPVVSRILHEGPEMAYLKFNYLIKELPHDLSSQDIDALIGFIAGLKPQRFQEGEWGSLVNDIEECLTVQNVPNKRVSEALFAIFRDETQSQMQRDYALQHVGGFAIYLVHTGAKVPATGSSSPSTLNPQLSTLFNPLLSELKSAAGQSSKPWSGTALNLLDGLLRAAEYRSVEIPGLSAATLVEMAVPIARDPSAPLNARLPALQLASRHDSPAARDLAREILSSPQSGLMLVQCASGALSRLGTSEDLPLLQTASARASSHTAPAINKAIQEIQTRSASN